MEQPPEYSIVKKYYPEYEDIYLVCEKILASCAEPGMMVLDAGCGAGNPILQCCITQNIKVIGVDNDPEALKRNESYDDTFLCDVGNLPFSANTFDVVTAFYLMEHLKNPHQALSEFARVLKKDGILLMALPNLMHPVMFGTRLTPFSLHVVFHKLFTGISRPYRSYFRCNTVSSLDKTLRRLGLSREKLVRRGSWGLFRKVKPLMLFWVVCDKITNFPIFQGFKADICVLYRKND